MINQCRLYLRVFTAFDLYANDDKQLHPELINHFPVQSSLVSTDWISVPKPLQKIWTLWDHMVSLIVKCLQRVDIIRDASAVCHYSNTHLYCTRHGMLHCPADNDYQTFLPKCTQVSCQTKIFINANRIIDRDINTASLHPVKIYQHITYITILGQSPLSPPLPPLPVYRTSNERRSTAHYTAYVVKSLCH